MIMTDVQKFPCKTRIGTGQLYYTQDLRSKIDFMSSGIRLVCANTAK